jgi:hypothetical protein
MANQQTSDNYSGKFPDFVPFLNFVALIQQNSKLSTCREFPSMQRAYTHFWEKALSQYEEEAQRLMRITQGAVEDATHIAQEAQERIQAANGNADGRGASSSPSPTKRASPSHRDSA